MESYAKHPCPFIISARQTPRWVEELKAAARKPSPRTDADGECEFRYPPEGWGRAYRFLALRYDSFSVCILVYRFIKYFLCGG